MAIRSLSNLQKLAGVEKQAASLGAVARLLKGKGVRALAGAKQLPGKAWGGLQAAPGAIASGTLRAGKGYGNWHGDVWSGGAGRPGKFWLDSTPGSFKAKALGRGAALGSDAALLSAGVGIPAGAYMAATSDAGRDADDMAVLGAPDEHGEAGSGLDGTTMALVAGGLGLGGYGIYKLLHDDDDSGDSEDGGGLLASDDAYADDGEEET
jgi:hypothetical protein